MYCSIDGIQDFAPFLIRIKNALTARTQEHTCVTHVIDRKNVDTYILEK